MRRVPFHWMSMRVVVIWHDVVWVIVWVFFSRSFKDYFVTVQ